MIDYLDQCRIGQLHVTKYGIPFTAPLASWNAAIPGRVPLKITAATIMTRKIRL